MSVAPDPTEIFDRAAAEGRRRLGQTTLELVSTSFIAGFTVVFGIAALGVAEALFSAVPHGIATVAGALAFAVSFPFLVVGRTELFNENFVDPVAAAVEADGYELAGSLLRLWSLTFALNLVGGALMVAVLSVEGALPTGTAAALNRFAEDVVARPAIGGFASSVVGGALVSLMSFLLQAVDGVGDRIWISYAVGVLLALGPFDHVLVTVLHLEFGLLLGAEVSLAAAATVTVIVTAGNLVGGLGLVTVTHVAQFRGAEESESGG